MMKGSTTARRTSAFLAMAALAFAIAATSVPTDAAAQFAEAAQPRCQQELAHSSLAYLERVLAARIRCEKRAERSGNASVDCLFGAGDDKLQRALQDQLLKLDRALPAACTGVNLLFLNFPGTCPDSTGAPFDSADLEACVVSQSNDVIANLLGSYYPQQIDLAGRREATCLAKTAKDAFAMFRFNIRARYRCLLEHGSSNVDGSVKCRADIPPYGPGTNSERVDLDVRHAYLRLLGRVPARCARAQIDALGYQQVCPDSSGGLFTTLDMQICLFNKNRDQTPPALAIAFPTAPVCGNGRIEGDEQCDNGDSNSDTAANACRKDCRNAHCGDSVTDSPEQCDDGNSATLDGCLPSCINEVCGDGVVNNNRTEQCDNGPGNSDSAPNTCRTTCRNPSCGDAVTDPLFGGEQCDNGNANSDTTANACRKNCRSPRCGDSVTDTGEQCDDGNSASLDGCLPTCIKEVCGDGVINNHGTEQCDNGDSNSDTDANACREDCKNAHCGDAVVDAGEQCDDGNLASLDGCTSTCVTETCGDGIVNNHGTEQCDNGANNSDIVPNACRTDCRRASCGDGVTDPLVGGEQCDDGAGNSDTIADACRTTCKNPRCGDSVTDSAEQCDDGNTNNSDACKSCILCGNGIVTPPEQCDNGASNSDTTPDACRSSCLNPSCGDGVVDPLTGAEQCDDHNVVSNDDCSSTCKIESCGDAIKQTKEQCDGDAAPCGAGEGCSSACTCDLACPGFGELTLYSGISDDCTTNADCVVGQCDPDLGRCRTATRLDSGWTGQSHKADINNRIITRGYLDCSNKGPLCGVCNVVGVDPTGGTCRCSNDTRTTCDKPFAADAAHCGGATCNCYFGSPFPLSSAGTPACIVNRFSQDIFGTADVDLGAGQITANLSTDVFLGISTNSPCPVCGGTCSDNAGVKCVVDADCATGTCQLDPVNGDGVRGGICIDGRNAGLACDIGADNTSFPARSNRPGGGGYSLDCLPDTGKIASGAGLAIKLAQTTGTVQLAANVPCGNNLEEFCPCGQCSTNTNVTCTEDADCADQPGTCFVFNNNNFNCTTDTQCRGVNAGTCTGIKRCSLAAGKQCTANADCNPADLGACLPSTCGGVGADVPPEPNTCDGRACNDIGDGEGECATGPDAVSCDAVVRANGMGILSCNANDDCLPEVVGIAAGNCTLVERRKCFLDPIVASGQPSPTAPIGVAVFCIPKTTATSINLVAGLPGPGRSVNQATSRLFCESDPSRRYTPGVGGCLD